MQSDDAPGKASALDQALASEPDGLERQSLLNRLGGVSIPGATLSNPSGSIIADPAWVFERRPSEMADVRRAILPADDSNAVPRSVLSERERSEAIAALIAEAKAARSRDTHQATQEGPGDSSDPKEQDH